MKKTLRLRSESLTELTSAELEVVNGAVPPPTYQCSNPNCPSLDYCNLPKTLPVRECIQN
jgi:hypothetical protein